ncbi:MAG: von Willebrand factor type A domain-containing protein [Planctomycetaceae bacterium]|nr:von Willebrand factor type A domain-containing protein [Planctomycetaceae bacterium]
MSHDAARNREDCDILLTAYALGELSGEDLAAVERLLADPAATAARTHVAEVRATTAALKAARTADLPERSADLRRAVLAAAVGGGDVIPAATPRPRRRGGLGTWVLTLGSCAAVALVAAGLLLPAVQSSRQAARRQVAFAEGRRVVDAEAFPSPPVDAPFEAATREQFERPAADYTLSMPVAGRSDADFGGRAVPGPTKESQREGLVMPNTERYNRFADSRFRAVGEQPLSTFSIDVDTASYANVRRFLTAGQRPPRDAVRIEELVNYFRYDYPQPKGDEPFSVTVDAATCPWREGHRLVRVGLQGRDVARDARPAGNLVFLVDVSGSMDEPDKLPLVQRALLMLVDELTENDRVAIVTYAGNAGLVLPSTSGDQKAKIRAAIAALRAGGSTHGSAGINLAYEQAAERFIQGGANRVILCTDGDLNVGVTSDEALVDLITKKAAGGTFLTVLGFGTGNLQDEKMEKLADNGNGVYAYIDGVREARKVLVEQLTGSTITIAKDVKIQVEFNPAQVASYRLLGYENRVLAAEDFRDDKKDAGEIGAGHTVTALYEIVLVGDEAGGDGVRGAEPLKYQPAPAPAPPEVKPAVEPLVYKPTPTPALPAAQPAVEGPVSRELLTVKLRWKKPDGDTSTLLEVPLAEKGGAFAAAPADLRFAAAVAAFGMILRESEHKGTATLPFVAEIAGSSLGHDAGGYRAEFLDLVRKAEAVR